MQKQHFDLGPRRIEMAHKEDSPRSIYAAYGLPENFGPDHPDWNAPSKQAKYRQMLENAQQPALQERKEGYGLSKAPGRTCVFSVVSGEYAHLMTPFLYCLRKAYPHYDVKIFVRTPGNHSRLLSYSWPKDEWEMEEEEWGYRDPVEERIDDIWQKDGLATAALRFLVGDDFLSEYDYVFISDIDVLIMREKPELVQQHLTSMRQNCLDCYDNYLRTPNAMQGMHFVTRQWWPRTRQARDVYLSMLAKGISLSKGWDEEMLCDIVRTSGLQLPDGTQNLWANHGLHLGTFRDREPREGDLGAAESIFVKHLANNKEFISVVDALSSTVPHLKRTFDCFRRIYG